MVVRQHLTGVMPLTSGSDTSRRGSESRTERACELDPIAAAQHLVFHNTSMRESGATDSWPLNHPHVVQSAIQPCFSLHQPEIHRFLPKKTCASTPPHRWFTSLFRQTVILILLREVPFTNDPNPSTPKVIRSCAALYIINAT